MGENTMKLVYAGPAHLTGKEKRTWVLGSITMWSYLTLTTCLFLYYTVLLFVV